MPRSVVEQLFALDTRLDHAIDRLGSAFDSTAIAIARSWMRLAGGVVSGLPRNKAGGLDARRAGRAGLLGTQLEDLNAAGGRAFVKGLDAFADVSTLATRALKVAGLNPKLRDVDLQVLTAYRALKVVEFQALERSFTDKATALVRKAIVSSQDPAETILELDEVFTPFRAQARALYETAIAEFSQVITASKTAGEARVYLYTGPIDGRSRPFCLNLVGRVYSRAVIDKLDNRQMANTFLTRGGWHCRHQWRDVTEVRDLAPLADTGRYASPEIAARVAAARVAARAPRRQTT